MASEFLRFSSAWAGLPVSQPYHAFWQFLLFTNGLRTHVTSVSQHPALIAKCPSEPQFMSLDSDNGTQKKMKKEYIFREFFRIMQKHNAIVTKSNPHLPIGHSHRANPHQLPAHLDPPAHSRSPPIPPSPLRHTSSPSTPFQCTLRLCSHSKLPTRSASSAGSWLFGAFVTAHDPGSAE